MQGVAIALAFLTLAIGLCVFDGDDHDITGHPGALDLCLGMLGVSLAMPAVGWLLIVGAVSRTPAALVRVVARRVPDPPPRSQALR